MTTEEKIKQLINEIKEEVNLEAQIFDTAAYKIGVLDGLNMALETLEQQK